MIAILGTATGFAAAILATVIGMTTPCAADPGGGWSFAPGTGLAIECDTKAVVVAADAAKASNGAITLQLTAPPAAGTPGVWTIISVSDQHDAAFAKTQRTACNEGCPLSVQPAGEIHLWAPKPNSLDKLAEGELLLLAVLKPATLALRASTFRGKDIEALEEGVCRKVTP